MSLSLALPILLVLAAQAPAAVTSADEAAIKDVVKHYVDARERGDEASVAALFTADADQLVSSGEWRRGREALVRGALASTARGGTRTIAVETIRLVAPGVVVADGRYEISGLEGAAIRRMWSTFVMVREQGAWRISAIRNMLPAAAAPAAPPVR